MKTILFSFPLFYIGQAGNCIGRSCMKRNYRVAAIDSDPLPVDLQNILVSGDNRQADPVYDYYEPQLVEGFAIRALRNGVSRFNLYGLPIACSTAVKDILEVLLDPESSRVAQTRPVAVTYKLVSVHSHLWAVNCFSLTENFMFAKTLVTSQVSAIESNAMRRCQVAGQYWVLVSMACSLSNQDSQFLDQYQDDNIRFEFALLSGDKLTEHFFNSLDI